MNVSSLFNWLISRIRQPWNIMRLFRLLAGIYFGYEAVAIHQIFAGFLSIFLVYQAVTATGCCGTAACSNEPEITKAGDESQVVEYEEVVVK